MTNPIVLGGKGGSGTKAFSLVVRTLGYDMGNVNNFMDATAFTLTMHKHYTKFLDTWYKSGYMAGINE